MKRVIILVFVILVVFSCILLVYMGINEGFDSLESLKDGEYYRLILEEKNPRAELTSFLVTDTVLILYYDAEALVNVYTLNGKFLYGIQVELIRNGTGNFAYHNGMLYIMSRGNRMYIFQDKELIKSFLHSESPAEFAVLETLVKQSKNHSIEDTTYYYIAASNQITKITPKSTMETVISLPQVNSNIKSVTFFLLIMIVVFMHYLKHTKVYKTGD